MIVFSEKEEYKFDKVLLLDDGGYKANRSLFEFFNIFGEQKVDVLRVNVDDKDLTGERFKENYNLISKEGRPIESSNRRSWKLWLHNNGRSKNMQQC